MPGRCIGAIAPNLSLLYHRNVRPIDIYLSRLILEAAGATMSFVFLTLFFSFIGWLELPEDILQVVGGWLMLAWFGFGLALFLGALSEASETVEKLWHPAAYFSFPLSGAAFLVDALTAGGTENSCFFCRWSTASNIFAKAISVPRSSLITIISTWLCGTWFLRFSG